MGNVIYRGIDLSQFNITITGFETWKSPEWDFEEEEVPGKNGTVLIDNHRYKNVDIPYTIGVKRPVAKTIEALRSFFLSSPGYHRLEDTWNPDQFRLAAPKGSITPSVKVRGRLAEFDITFNCKPQRFLKAGEIPAEYTGNGSIFNPTGKEALPIVRVYGTGYLGIGDETIQIKQNPGYIDIDCERMNAYMGSLNCNSYTKLASGSYYHLDPGENGIAMDNTITKVIITPKWWIV